MENLLCREVYELSLRTSMRRRLVRVLPIVTLVNTLLFNWATGDGWLAALAFIGFMMAIFAFVFPRTMVAKFRLLWNSVAVAEPNVSGELLRTEVPYQLICDQKQHTLPGWPGGAIYFARSRLVFVPYRRNSLQHQHAIEMGSADNMSVSVAPPKRSGIKKFFFGPESALSFCGPNGEFTFNVPDPEMTLEVVQTALKVLCSEGEVRSA